MFFLIPLLLSQFVQAHPSRPCAFEIDPPTPIRRHPQPFYPIEVKTAEGIVVEYGQRIPKLETGTWLYLVTTQRHTLLVPKYLVERYIRDGRGLTTHKTLMKLFAAKYGLPVQHMVGGPGELVVSSGQVSIIRNKAGNFRAGEYHMDFGISVLQAGGLPFADGYVKVVLDPEIKPLNPEEDAFDHTRTMRNRDLHRLEIMTELRLHKHGADLSRLYKQLGNLMVEIYGAEAGSGGALKLMQLSRGMRMPGRFSFFWPLTTASEFTGMDFGILGSMHKLTEFPDPDAVWFDKIAPKMINLVLDDTTVRRSARQDFLLRQIATEFQAIRYQPHESYPNPVDENI